jgi:putative ABC transport system permease protein
MFKNNLKIAWRNLKKNKVSAVINIFGLSVGLACCILMAMFVQHELGYDKFHKNASNIYRVTSIAEGGPTGKINLAVTPSAWAPLIKKDYPEVKQIVRVLKDEKTLLGQKGKEHSFAKTLLLVDSNFFNIFSFKLLQGNAATALSQPNSLVLTPQAAKRYFGTEDPIGKQ